LARVRPSGVQMKVEDGAPQCMDAYVLNDFSSPENMLLAGWLFWGEDFKFQPSDYDSYVPEDSFWGFSGAQSAKMTLKLTGAGKLTLDFGNSASDDSAKVLVALNGEAKSSAGPFTFSQDVKFDFKDGDELSISEAPEGVIVINKIGIECARPKAPKDEAPGSPESKGVNQTEKAWKLAYDEEQIDKLDEHKDKEELKEEEALERAEQQRLGEEMRAAEKEAKEVQEDLKEHKPDQAAAEADAELKVLHREEEAEKIKEALIRQVAREKKDIKSDTEAAKKDAHKDQEYAKSLEKSLGTKESSATEDLSLGSEVDQTLYCWSLMLPFGYEPGLLKKQYDRGAGIFGCDKAQVFTNSTTLLDSKTSEQIPILKMVELLDFSLSVPFGGKWYTALNTDVFNRIWQKVVALGVYRNYAWTVKADPDTVFFPDRLRLSLRSRVPKWIAQKRNDSGCGTCGLPRFYRDDCAASVRYLQQSHTCEEALRLIARPVPTDCGCVCTAEQACDWPARTDGEITSWRPSDPSAMYINNCKFGLHGPLELLNNQAVTLYVDSLSSCTNLPNDLWGEDKYLDRCMLQLGVTRVNWFNLLSETACGETPAPCISNDIAFHPFKTADEYFACQASARAFGDVQV